MLKRGPKGCEGALKRSDGTSMTGQEVYDLMWQRWLEGFEVLPDVCDNHGPDGHCLGHPIEAQ
jgi:hypothetical protein